MKTSVISEIYNDLMSLSEGQEKTIELETGAKIVLTFRDYSVYIIFKSKNHNIKEIGFWGYIINSKIKTLDSFYDLHYFDFKKLKSLQNEGIKEGNTKDFTLGRWIFDGGCIRTIGGQIQVKCNTWEQGIEDLIEFFREITLLTTGCELDENLALKEVLK